MIKIMDNKSKLIYLSIDCSNYFNESSKEEKDIINYKESILKEFNKGDNLDILKTFTNKYKEKYFLMKRIMIIFHYHFI